MPVFHNGKRRLNSDLKGILSMEKPALLIIDMVKDYFKTDTNYPITKFGLKIIPSINMLIWEFRNRSFPIIFSTDAFEQNDFLFKGKMHPHSIAGTPGAQVVEELDMQENDLWLPKPKFSAFFNTDLKNILMEQSVTTCVVAGITTNFCVLTTAMDALCHDFKAIIVEDCTAASSKESHHNCLNLYRRNALYPLFRIMDSEKLMVELLSMSKNRK